MPWIVKLIPNNDTSLYNSKCATCHREDRKGVAGGAVARGRRQRGARATRSRRSSARAPAGCRRFPDMGARNINDLVEFLITGNDKGDGPGAHERSELARIPQRRRDDLPRSRRLSRRSRRRGARSTRSISTPARSAGRFRSANFPSSPRRAHEHRQRQLRRSGRHRRRAALHRRDELRQEVPRLRQAHRQAAVGNDAAGGRQRDAVHLHAQRPASTSSSPAAAARTARRRAAASSRSRCRHRDDPQSCDGRDRDGSRRHRMRPRAGRALRAGRRRRRRLGHQRRRRRRRRCV